MGEIELLALAERVEKLSGPCEAVDLEIARIQRVVCLRRNAEDTANEEFTHWRYTASLNAAMSLVPEGAEWDLEGDFERKGNSGYHCGMNWYADGYYPHVWVSAATPALAITAAALRARASITRTTGDGDGNG